MEKPNVPRWRLVSLLRYTFLLKHLCIFFFSFLKQLDRKRVQSIWSCRISDLFHHLPLHQLPLAPIFIFSLLVNFSENSMFMLWMGKIISGFYHFSWFPFLLCYVCQDIVKIPRVVKIKNVYKQMGEPQIPQIPFILQFRLYAENSILELFGH